MTLSDQEQNIHQIDSQPKEIKKPQYHHQFRWDSSVPQQVLIKGSFDQWQSSLELIKEPSGKFGRSIELDHGSRVSYKYIIDGVWRHNPNEPTETDSSGNINNVFAVPEYVPSESEPSDEESQAEPTTTDPQTTQEPQTIDDNKSLTNTAVFPSESPQRAKSKSTSPSPSARLPTKSMIGSRTHSLMSQSRSRHTSYHSPSFLSSTIAPGTPTEKSTPAQTSVSTVVSAMAGAAATAIPAAIFAVTGKDIIRNSGSSNASIRSMPATLKTDNVERGVQLPNSTPDQKLLKSGNQETPPILVPLNDAKENEEVVKGNSEVDTHLPLEPSSHTESSEPKEGNPENKTSTDLSEVQEPTKPEPIVGGGLQSIEETGSEVSQNDKQATNPADELANQSTSVNEVQPPTEAVLQAPVESKAPEPSTPSFQPTAAAVPEQPAKLEVQPPPTEPVFAQPSITTPEPSVKPSPASQTTPKIPATPERSILEADPSKAKYGTLSPDRSTPQQLNKNGGWRVSIGSIGKKSSPLIGSTPDGGVGGVQNGEESSTPIRKRKTSLFQKIKVALSPGHGSRKPSESSN